MKNLVSASGKRPRVSPGAQVHAQAVLVGDVSVLEGAQVWPGVLIRGHPGPVVISKGAIVMDDAAVLSMGPSEVVVGEMTLIGQRALLSGCSIGARCLVGPDCRVLEAVIGAGCILEQGVVVGAQSKVPSGTLLGTSGPKGPVSKAQTEMLVKHREAISRKFAEYGCLKALKEDA